jgi:hypothetical protein
LKELEDVPIVEDCIPEVEPKFIEANPLERLPPAPPPLTPKYDSNTFLMVP